jgi:predicted dehydrogenase
LDRRLRVGVVGCGLIAQVMHLHYLRELEERFEIAAICDLADDVRDACARDFGIPRTFSDWHDLLKQKLDAVLVLTSGSHAPVAIAAAQAGMHVLVEKPMCFSVAEGQAMIAAAEKAATVLMVAYAKRYDPAYERLAAELKGVTDLRLARVTTLESPLQPYVAHYPLRRGRGLPESALAVLQADSLSRVAGAIGEVDPLSRWAYQAILLDTLVHEFNAIRGLLGEPDSLEFADIRETDVTVVLRFGGVRCVITWVDLPGMARYLMEFAFYAPQRRFTLAFPSPFLRNMPTVLTTEGGEEGTARSWRSEEVVSYDEAFKRELIHFHDCVTRGRPPVTSAGDALRDIALCQSVVAAHRSRSPRERPTDPS